jgi:hypothetical protein
MKCLDWLNMRKSYSCNWSEFESYSKHYSKSGVFSLENKWMSHLGLNIFVVNGFLYIGGTDWINGKWMFKPIKIPLNKLEYLGSQMVLIRSVLSKSDVYLYPNHPNNLSLAIEPK